MSRRFLTSQRARQLWVLHPDRPALNEIILRNITRRLLVQAVVRLLHALHKRQE